MQLDHPGDDGIPGQVGAVLRRRAFAEIDDQPQVDREPALLDHPLGENQPRIRQNEAIVVHVGFLQAARFRAKRVTSTSRSAR